VPPELHHDLDYIVDMIDWEPNVDPHFVEHRLIHPRAAGESDEFFEKWVIYSTPCYIETPAKIRFGQLTNDELFVSATRAREGVTITNRSDKENLVILKHFGPANAWEAVSNGRVCRSGF